MNDEKNYVTQEQFQARRTKIKETYEKLNNESIRTDEHIKSIEKTFSILSKIMISVVAAIVLLIIKGALKI